MPLPANVFTLVADIGGTNTRVALAEGRPAVESARFTTASVYGRPMTPTEARNKRPWEPFRTTPPGFTSLFGRSPLEHRRC